MIDDRTSTVSIALISYDQARWIRDAVAGINRQELTVPCNVIVADDCSQDGTLEILKRELDSTRFEITYLPSDRRLGMHQNWLRALAACRGKYLAVLEGDDYWTDPHKLARQVSAMDAHPQWCGCFHRIRVVDRDGRALYERPEADWSRPEVGFSDLIGGNSICTVSVMYRNGLVEKYPDEFLHLKQIDWPMHLLHARGGSFGFLPQSMGVYRDHGGGVWSSQPPSERYRAILQACDALEDYFGAETSAPIRTQRRNLVDDLCRQIDAGRDSTEYRLGHALLRPLRFLRDRLKGR